MKLKYTILYVDDVRASVAFYEAAFGLTATMVHEAGDFAMMSTGDVALSFCSRALLRQLGKEPAPADPKRPVFEIAFETNDVAGSLKKALAAGAQLVTAVREEPWGQTISYISDPNGFLIEICSPVRG